MTMKQIFTAAVLALGTSGSVIIAGFGVANLAGREDHAGLLEPVRQWAQTDSVQSYVEDRNGLATHLTLFAWPAVVGSALIAFGSGMSLSSGRSTPRKENEGPLPPRA